jgi:hypothetical protein
MCAARAADNMLAPGAIFTPDSTPGRYQRTMPGPSQPLHSNAASWKPFALRTASQFRPGGPPELQSPTYGRDLAEVQRLGGTTSRERTLEQEEIALWHSEPATQQLNRIARAEIAADGKDLLEHARLFALLNLALIDATTSVFDAKYAYASWRPVTAIRHADRDRNPHTSKNATWSSFLLTPPHPGFPSEQAASRAAGARVMTAYFGKPHAFQSTSSAVPGLTRVHESFDAFAREGALARIFAGTNFRSSVEQGARQGTQVADWVLGHDMLPVESR